MARGPSNKTITAFNAGEWSPKLDARVDLNKYASACIQLQNMTLLPYGGAVRRPGLEYIAAAKFGDKPCRLMEFQFSTTTTFTLELGHQYLRFYSNGAQVTTGGPPAPYEIATPYLSTQVFQVQKIQANDVVYLVHPLHAPRKLVRVADDNWTLTVIEFNEPPFLDENLTATTITASLPSGSTGAAGQPVVLTATTAIFSALHAGSYWRLRQLRAGSSVERDIDSDGNSPTIPILGDWNFRTYGYWSADLYLERSFDNGSSWEVIRVFLGEWDRNVDAVGKEDEKCLFRCRVANHNPTVPSGVDFVSNGRLVIEAVPAYIDGIFKLNTVGSGGATGTGTVIKQGEAYGVATKMWNEGAWSAVRGYPRAGTLYEQRMIYAGTEHQPQTIWGSVTADYENFQTGIDDDLSWAYTIGAQERNAILWVVAQNHLLIGTTGGEWRAGGGEGTEPITPSSIRIRRQSNYGSADVLGRVVNEVVLFPQRNGRKIRELVFSFERDGYVAPDLTILAEHVTEGGVVQTAYQQQPDSILWAITGAGRLVGMTYEREQDVVGWHRHETLGAFESVATIYGSGDDEVWVVVRRLIDGAIVRYIERLNPAKWTVLDDAFFVDSGVTVDGGGSLGVDAITAARPPVVSCTGHGFSDGDLVRMRTNGIAAIEGKVAVVTNKSTDGFELFRVDGTPYDLRLATVYVAIAAFDLGTGSWEAFIGTHDFEAGDDIWAQESPGEDPLPTTVISVTATSIVFAELNARIDNFETGRYFLRAGSTAYAGGGTVQRVFDKVTGLEHLEGETVQLLVDGGAHPDQVVSGGEVELDEPGTTIHCGLGYASILQPMRLDVDPASGPSMGQVKQVREVVVRLLNTLGLSYGDGEDEWMLPFRDTNDFMDEPPPLFTGDKQLDFDGDFDFDGTVILSQRLPMPMTVLAMVIKHRVTGR